MTDVTVIVVSWNVRGLLRQCLHSVQAGGAWGANADCPAFDLQVIVVDNASGDGSAEMVASEFPQVHLIRNAHNRGFSGGSNQGLALGNGRYLLLLNPDTELAADALATMIRYMDTHPQAGALGPRLVYGDGRLQSSRRRFPTLSTALVESTVVQEHWPNNEILRRYYMADMPEDAIQPVDWVVGACLFVRREVFRQVGGLDEGYFMYSEEMDWCRRIKAAGWQVIYLPTAIVTHHEGKSSEQVVAARHVHFQTSKVRYFRKYHGALQAELLRLYLLATYVYQWCREALKWLMGHKRPLRTERMRAYCQVLRSGLRTRQGPASGDGELGGPEPLDLRADA